MFLDLQTFTLDLWNKDWSALHPDLVRAISGTCGLKGLRKLHLMRIGNFPTDLITLHISQLKILSVYDVEFLPGNMDSAASQAHSAYADFVPPVKNRLDVLDIGFNLREDFEGLQLLLAALESPQSRVDIKNVKVLKICGNHEWGDSAIGEVMGLVEGKLECFIWDTFDDYNAELYALSPVEYRKYSYTLKEMIIANPTNWITRATIRHQTNRHRTNGQFTLPCYISSNRRGRRQIYDQ